MPKLTIGMAHFEDYDGVYFSLQSLRLHHPEAMKDVEFVVIDNSPGTGHGKQVQQNVKSFVGSGTAGAKYVPYEKSQGTSQTRNAIFEHATGDAVLVMDCHVLHHPNSIKRLIDFYDANPGTNDIYSGPLVYDSMMEVTTHFNDQWRGEMWGVWGSTWKGDCGEVPGYFSVIESEAGNPRSQAKYVALSMGQVPVSSVGGCHPFPTTTYAGHQRVLFDAGFKYHGHDVDDEPFEIPGQGLGVFSCRREAWPGFNPDALGFGGEELYIHEKFRQRGGKAMCLPFLRWVHRFGRPNGVKYPLTRYNKVRNYILEFQELGMDVEPIHEHFVGGGKFPEDVWQKLVADPIHLTEEALKGKKEKGKGCNTCGGKQTTPEINLAQVKNMEDLFSLFAGAVRDLNEHFPKLKELAEQCSHITEFSKRRESSIAFLSGKPKKLVSHNSEWHESQEMAERFTKEETEYVHSVFQSHMVAEIEETDMLFLDSTHTHDYINLELRKFAGKVKRYIVVHDTMLYGERGEDGKLGVLPAMRTFMKENPHWSVVYHTNDQYGLTVMGCQDKDKPKLPSTITMAKNFAKSIAEHVVDGAQKVPDEVLEKRLLKCSTCPYRANDRCSVCGCYIAKKAAWKSQVCPIGLWGEEVIEEKSKEKETSND